MAKKDHIRRIPPCPAWDLEAMASWLTDLAQSGWMLEEDGYSCGRANFRREAPRSVRYRLVGAWPAPKSLWASGVQYEGAEPEAEALALNALYGWEYVAKRGRYFIYRTQDPSARELDTDPQVQYFTLRALTQWAGRDLVWSLLVVAWLWFWLLWREPDTLQILWTKAPLFTLCCLLPLAALLFWRVGNLRGTRRLAKKLRQGTPLDHHKDWNASAPKHYLGLAVTAGAFTLCFLAAVWSWWFL